MLHVLPELGEYRQLDVTRLDTRDTRAYNVTRWRHHGSDLLNNENTHHVFPVLRVSSISMHSVLRVWVPITILAQLYQLPGSMGAGPSSRQQRCAEYYVCS